MRHTFGTWCLRRVFLPVIGLGLALVACSGAPEREGVPPPAPATPGATSVEHAVAVGAWLRSIEVLAQDAPPWPDDALVAGEATSNLANGVAGKVWFFLALHEATGEASYLRDVSRGADYLVVSLSEVVRSDQIPPPTSLYYGLPGVCVALDAAARATGNDRYSRGAASCLNTVKARARETDTGAEWSARFDDLLFGNTGTALYLLEVAERQGDPAAGALAVRAGRALIARAVADRGGRTWKFRRDADFVLPNFSHGAAGVGYLMAALYQYTGDEAFLDAARGAAAYLDGIARTDGGVYLVPYGWPNREWEGLYEAGWAHGAAGTARFFERLWQATADEGYRERVAQAARGLEALAAEAARGEREADARLDMRFGSAGAAMFLIDAAGPNRDPALLAAARARLDAIVASATRDEAGLHWVTPRPAFVDRPGEPAAYTGYLTGAAGYGLLLLRYAAAVDGRPWGWRFVDDPF